VAAEIRKIQATTYKETTVELRGTIIASIFPENCFFSETGYRTAKVNTAANLTFQINEDLTEKKTGTTKSLFIIPV
jgi:hypothetical protein